MQVRANLARRRVPAIVPGVLPQFTTRMTLVMDFCEGAPRAGPRLASCPPPRRAPFPGCTPLALAAPLCPCHAPSPHAHRRTSLHPRAGAPLKDPAALREAGIDCDLVVARVCEAWAAQILADGLFNADPHAGNLLVTRQPPLGDVPVLLDFGLCKRLAPAEHKAFCMLVHGAPTLRSHP